MTTHRSETPAPSDGPDTLRAAVGRVLRTARTARGMTLRDVRVASSGRFKPSLLGAYERGERSISVARFIELAAIYRTNPDGLIRDAAAALHGESHAVVIDLGALPSIRGDEARAIAAFIHEVRSERGDYLTDVITLRTGDLEAVAATLGVAPRALHQRLDSAIHGVRHPRRARAPHA